MFPETKVKICTKCLVMWILIAFRWFVCLSRGCYRVTPSSRGSWLGVKHCIGNEYDDSAPQEAASGLPDPTPPIYQATASIPNMRLAPRSLMTMPPILIVRLLPRFLRGLGRRGRWFGLFLRARLALVLGLGGRLPARGPLALPLFLFPLLFHDLAHRFQGLLADGIPHRPALPQPFGKLLQFLLGRFLVVGHKSGMFGHQFLGRFQTAFNPHAGRVIAQGV
jgi:hypothetical protein